MEVDSPRVEQFFSIFAACGSEARASMEIFLALGDLNNRIASFLATIRVQGNSLSMACLEITFS